MASIVFIGTIYPFLAVNQPIGSGSLVVEGWMNRTDVLETIALFQRGDYEGIYTTGGPVSDGSYLSLLYPTHKTLAEIAAHQFVVAGVADDRVTAVPRGSVTRNRTYSSALALRFRLVADGLDGYRLDVLSSGPHARRSWLLYQAALRDIADVGVKSLPPTSYDSNRWWMTSSGFRTVISECIAYCYAKFLFYPDVEGDIAKLRRNPN